MKINDYDHAAVGRRLTALRKYLGLTGVALAQELGVTPVGLRYYESGERSLDVGIAIDLVERTGLTLDWLYRGDARGLDPRLAWAYTSARGGAAR